jgi:hypothetical protein
MGPIHARNSSRTVLPPSRANTNKKVDSKPVEQYYLKAVSQKVDPEMVEEECH